jgi:3-polyprenyl-4-hydroxybenzoate decarboxylase
MMASKTLFSSAAPVLYLVSSAHPKQAIRDAIAEVQKAYDDAALDLEQLKGLERVFVDEIEALKSQYSMKPERKQEKAWKQVTKEETYEKIKLLPLASVYAEDEGWEKPRPRGFSI